MDPPQLGGGDSVRYSDDNSPPTKEDILFRENHWYVLKMHYEEVYAGDTSMYTSGVGHDCQHFNDDVNAIQILGGDDVLAGMCWWCKEEVPVNIQTVWTLHNFDQVQRIDPASIEYCKAEANEVVAERKWAVHWKGEEE